MPHPTPSSGVGWQGLVERSNKTVRTVSFTPITYPMQTAMRSRHWSLIAAALAFAALSVPYLLTHNSALVGFALQHAFSLVCHQRPERSIWIFGAPIAVCARCLGIYVGAALGFLRRTSRRIAFQLLIVAAGLSLLDWFTEAVGLHGNCVTARFIFGLALGATAGLLVSSSIPDATCDPCDDGSKKVFAAGLTIR